MDNQPLTKEPVKKYLLHIPHDQEMRLLRRLAQRPKKKRVAWLREAIAEKLNREEGAEL